MIAADKIEVIVVDVLGTLVDEPAGIRAGIREAIPDIDDVDVDGLLAVWQRYVEQEQRRIAQGSRAFVGTSVIDAEAARQVAANVGPLAPDVLARLASVSERLPSWGDSVSGLDHLVQKVPTMALSNADGPVLSRLSQDAGFHWHRTLSADMVGAYKPSREIYELAVKEAACPPERVLMVAAHAWDLRGAQAAGMRTAYIRRPVGDPPTAADAFDAHFVGLDDLATTLTGH